MTTKPRRRFAEGTEVPVERTRAELERLLSTHGARQFQVTNDFASRAARVNFLIGGRQVRLDVPPSERPDPAKAHAQPDWKGKLPRRWWSWGIEERKRWIEELVAQKEREAWRRLLLVTKAILGRTRVLGRRAPARRPDRA